jgi:hypothetical protein
MMKNSSPSKLRLILEVYLLVTSISTAGYNPMVTSPGAIPAVAAERRTRGQQGSSGVARR